MDLVYAATNGGMGQDFKTKSKWLAKKRTEQAGRWGFKPFICEIRLPEYKSTLMHRQRLNYIISVKLLILETIVSQRPCLIWTNKYKPSLCPSSLRELHNQTLSLFTHLNTTCRKRLFCKLSTFNY